MVIFVLLLLNVFLLFFTFSSYTDKKRIILPLAEALSVFLCIYALTSAFLWMFEKFTIDFGLLITTIADIIIFCIVYFRSSVKGRDFFAIGTMKIGHRIFLNRTALFLAVFASIGAYSTFGIGFNDGNAKIQALSILNGNNSLIFEIDEYRNILSGSEYEYFFFDSISNLDTENFTAGYELIESGDSDGNYDKMIGEYGNNPVYPSLLALSAKIFGIKHMAFIQAVFAFCLLAFIDELLKVLHCDWKLRSVLLVLLGVSPIMVYCTHTALVEPVIGFCMIFFIYFLLCKENKMQILSSLGVITFAFLHNSFYTMLPLFLIIYWMYFIHTGKKRHLISSGISVAGYVLSFIYLNIAAKQNTAINYRLGMPFLGEKYYLFVVIISAIAIVCAVALLIIFKVIKPEKLIEFKKRNGKLFFKIFVALASLIPVATTIITCVKKCDSLDDFQNITFIAFIVCSGVILIPYIWIRLVSTKYQLGMKEAAVITTFVYTVFLYSSAMRVTLDGYYYEARYLSSFIPFVILTAGIMLRLFAEYEKYYLPVISVIIMLVPYSAILLSGRADMRIDNEIFEDVLETAERNTDEDTVILIDRSLMKFFYYPIKDMDIAPVYPIDNDYVYEFVFATKDISSNVIYITGGNGDYYRKKGTVLYGSEIITSSFRDEDKSKIFGLPKSIYEENSGRLQVIKLDEMYQMLDYENYKKLEINDIRLRVNDVYIDGEGKAHISASVTNGSEMYYNDRYFISYHIDYETSEDEYESPRTPIGPVTVEDEYSFEFDLTELDESMDVIIDVVEEQVEWYSWRHQVPVVSFIRSADGTFETKVEYRVIGR